MAWHKQIIVKQKRSRSECLGVFSFGNIDGQFDERKKLTITYYMCVEKSAQADITFESSCLTYLVILTCAGRIPRSRQESIKMPLCTLLLRIKRIRGSARYLSIIYTHDVSRRTQIPKNKTTYMWKSGMDGVH